MIANKKTHTSLLQRGQRMTELNGNVEQLECYKAEQFEGEMSTTQS